jgi:hypothetical protein
MNVAADEREAWENELLVERFARAGALGGSIGGAAGGGGGGLLGGGRGGARGGRWGATRLKTGVCELELTLPADPEQALAQVETVLKDRGELIETPYAAAGIPTVVAVTGSMWQNPAVVTAEIRPDDGHGSRVKIRAVAKIGLLFVRRTSEKAAQQIREALTQK